MAACSGATGIPMSLLRQTKRAGCKAFDQAGRVHLAPLLAWLFAEENAESGTDWHQRYKRAQALAMENRTAEARGGLIDGAIWSAEIQKAAGVLEGVIFNEIETAPLRLAAAGIDIALNREVLRDVLWDFWDRFRETLKPAFMALQEHNDAAQQAILHPQPATQSDHESAKAR